MANLIEFGRVFLSYGLLLLVFAAVAAVGIFIGITLAKRKNEKEGSESGGMKA